MQRIIKLNVRNGRVTDSNLMAMGVFEKVWRWYKQEYGSSGWKVAQK